MFDSQKMHIGNMAAMLGEMKTACMEQGFNEEQAMQIVLKFMETTFGKGE